MAELHHLGRMPQSISLNDRDIMFFMHDRIKTNVSSNMIIKRSTTDSQTLFTLSTKPVANDRVLMWGRNVTSGLDDTSLINGMRVVPYIDSDTPYEDANQTLLPLREIISYKLSYDRVSNILTLLFWTNFSQAVTTYDKTKIVKINEDTVTNSTTLPASFVTVVPHLCVATAKIEQLNITGGVINETLTAPDKDNDFVPIFTKPKIMYRRAYTQPDTGVTGNVPILDFFTIKDGGAPVVCDCSGATSFEECWDMGWLQGVSFLAGGFKTRAFWTLLDNGVPVVGCEALANAIGSGNCNFSWSLDLVTEGTFGGIPYSNSSTNILLDNYPYVQGFSGGTVPVPIPMPFGGFADAEVSPVMGLYGCFNSLDSIDFFIGVRIEDDGPCEFWDGEVPCNPGDPRPVCATCV